MLAALKQHGLKGKTLTLALLGLSVLALGACSDSSSGSLPSYTVSTSTGNGGSIGPASATVNHGATTDFTLTSDAGYSIESVTGCDGSLSGNTYTTNTITADCTVTASFSLNSYSVGASVGTGGSIDPAGATVDHGTNTSFALIPDTGYSIAIVTGCSGILSGNTYTTGAITANCSVTASFTLNTYTVGATADYGGGITPAGATVDHGTTTSFTVTPDSLYRIVEVSGCGGTLSGNTYTTGEITTDCSLTASYAILSPQNLRATGVSEQVALAWEAIDSATEYCVYVSENPGITLDTASSYDNSLSVCTGLTHPGHTISGLTNGVTYFFAITGKKDSAETPLSNEVNATVGAQANDTGVTKCGNIGWSINMNPIGSSTLDCAETGATKTEPGIDSYGTLVPQGQDAFYGRDADTHLAKVGGGKAGFDFTRICNNGEAEGEGGCPAGMTANDIGDGANQWACNRDNVTGLMWEVKSQDSTHLRYYGHTYSFFKLVNDGALNSTGTENNGTCHDAINCDTDKFTIEVNANGGICGFNDWRMPMKEELRSILFLGAHNPAADTDYFPDTNLNPTDLSLRYWSADVYLQSGYAYGVSFVAGLDRYILYGNALRVRLVRSTGTSIFTVSAP